jgi:hypothetical protein
MPDDVRTVEVAIPVEAGVAPALADEATRARIGRLVSRMLRPPDIEGLFAVMDAISAEAERRGLTNEILDAELAAYNAERRDATPPG